MAVTRQYPDEAFIEAVKRLSEADGVFPHTSAIADEVGCSMSTAHRRLTVLADRGELKRDKYPNAILWTLPDRDIDGRRT